MSLLQIGELTTSLSDDFKSAYADNIDWRGLKSLRNLCAHNYSGIKIDVVWNEVNVFLPKFINFCKEQLQNINGVEYDNEENDEELEF